MKTKFTILFTVGLLFAAVATQAQTPAGDHRDIRHERADIRHDRREIVRNRRDIRYDRHEIYRDRRSVRFDRFGRPCY